MGRRHSHLAKRVEIKGRKVWVEACCEKFLPNGYPSVGRDARSSSSVPFHLGMTSDPAKVSCRACVALMPPDQAEQAAEVLEAEAFNGLNRIDTVVMLVTREEVVKVRVPALEPSSDRAELIAALNARGRGAVAVRTKPTKK